MVETTADIAMSEDCHNSNNWYNSLPNWWELWKKQQVSKEKIGTNPCCEIPLEVPVVCDFGSAEADRKFLEDVGIAAKVVDGKVV
jgi:hypothetical protein